MIYGSVCSGIEAASVAWKPLGWRCAFLSEIEPFPRAVLQHHYPSTPLHGDFTTIQAGDYEPIDLLVGGTPCQSFSVAGLRGGLADERGNLALEFLRLAERLRPRWLVWENVPGVLSSGGGRDFGSFLGGLVELGYGFAYRVLDAQFYGLAQRRKRVFVVGYLGDWRRAWAVLSQPASLRWDPPPRRETREGTTGTLSSRATAGGGLGTDSECSGGVVAATFLHCNKGRPDGRKSAHTEMVTLEDIVPTLATDGHAQSAVAIDLQNYALGGDVAGTLDTTRPTRGGGQAVMAFDARQSDVIQYGDQSGPLDTDGHTIAIQSAAAVRRLTPEECEALQGFPRLYTRIPYGKKGKGSGWSADGPRYRALGNSMAVPVMAWIGSRISAQEAKAQQAAA